MLTPAHAANVSNGREGVAGMARWTVEHRDSVLVIESPGPDGLVSLHVETPGAFLGDAKAIEELRTKLGLAIGEASQGEPL